MEGGEGYDYFYASSSDRDLQIRTDITDGLADKPWVYRYKDLRNWWSQLHYNRANGTENAQPTAWVPESKPIWLMEIGCPAIDKGANQPNVFYDPKSSESFTPYYSNGARDDLMQRRYIEAFISYWADNNISSSRYDGAMIDLDMINVWAWDARPYPDFPARSNIWSDGDNWERGHWLTGRTGTVLLADLVADICRQSGLTSVDTKQVTGLVEGYHLDRPMTGRAALTPLSALYGFNLIETAKGLRFASLGTQKIFELNHDDIVGDLSNSVTTEKSDPEDRLKDVRIHFIDASNDYQLGLSSARDDLAQTLRILDMNAPIVMGRSFARYACERILKQTIQSDQKLTFTLAPNRLDIEAGDYITSPNLGERAWQVQSLEGITGQRVTAVLAPLEIGIPLSGSVPAVTGAPLWRPKPVIFALDFPGYKAPLIGAALHPFSATRITGPGQFRGSYIYGGATHVHEPRSDGPLG